MILIILKKKHKIAYQMGVATSLKVKVCWKFELIRVHVGVSELTQNKLIRATHTKLKLTQNN